MRIRSQLVAALAIFTVASITACSMSSGSSSSSNRNRITGEQLATTNSSTVYEALEMLRPRWLNSRGPVSMTDSEEARANVYMNGTRVGDLEYLREVYVMDVEALRYWPPGEAGARFGMGNPRGVIEIIPRR